MIPEPEKMVCFWLLRCFLLPITRILFVFILCFVLFYFIVRVVVFVVLISILNEIENQIFDLVTLLCFSPNRNQKKKNCIWLFICFVSVCLCSFDHTRGKKLLFLEKTVFFLYFCQNLVKLIWRSKSNEWCLEYFVV